MRSLETVKCESEIDGDNLDCRRKIRKDVSKGSKQRMDTARFSNSLATAICSTSELFHM